MKQIFLFIVMMTSISALHATEQYPKTLSATDAMQYFAQHPKIEMKKPGEGFDFKIKGNDIERYCATCGTDTGYGNVKYRNHDNTICFDWDYVSFPDSGCFSFVQTSPLRFELQDKHGETVYAWGSGKKVVFKPSTSYKERFERAILIDLEEVKPSKDKIHAALLQAMRNKGWQIEKDDKDLVVAYLDRQGETYRVMAKIRGSWVGLGFVEGFAHSNNRWLHNIEKQLLIQLGH